jgi:tripartite-type tricarboxylate transporter receptor subunit TctC
MKGPNVLRPAAVLVAALAAMPANAQAYPDRPVKIVLPFGAGGVADVSSRIIADELGERLGQRFVIENMPGAGGISAAETVLAAPPNGHTLGLVTNGTAITAALFNRLPFDPTADFEMISTLGTFDLVFAVNAASPYKTLVDFVTAANSASRRGRAVPRS